MKSSKTASGRLGASAERVAAHHLESRGYTILERNWRTREGEIDLIATRDDELLFVEVRSRRGTAMGTPEESITSRKAEHLRAAAEAYLQAHPDAPPNQRLDVIALELDARGRLIRLEHIENAIEGA